MKEKSLFLHAMLVCLATAMCFSVASCSDDYDTPDWPTEFKPKRGTLVYQWDIKNDSSNEPSSFVSIPGKDMEVWIVENSKNIDTYGIKASGSPIAKIHVTTAKDTVWVSSVDDLKDFIDKTGNVSSVQSAQQKFGSELQEIVFDCSFEDSNAMNVGKTASMPYYPLEPVKFKDISVKDLGTATVSGKEYQLYEVSANFSQKVTQRNDTGKSADVEIEYIVKYIGAEELELVMVEYFPGGYWEEAHHNMPLSYYAYVERYRTYSNGERVGPDRFEDYGHWTWFEVGGSYVSEGYTEWPGDGAWTEGGPVIRTEIGDCIKIDSQSVKIWQMGVFNYPIFESKWTDGGFKNYCTYYQSNVLNDERFDVAKGVYCPVEYEEDSRPNGWYFKDFGYRYSVEVIPDHESGWSLGLLRVGFHFYDQFLVIDGRRIDFSSLHNFSKNPHLSEVKFSESNKEGIIAKLELDVTYLGKNFHAEQLDSIYVDK